MAGIGAGMTIAQNWGNPNIGSAVLNDAMAGASLGTAILPGIGTAIGAIGGAILGLFGSLFGDHGASQMRKYNDEQVVPAITKELTAYTAAQVGFDPVSYTHLHRHRRREHLRAARRGRLPAL